MIKDQNGDILNGANDYSITFTPPQSPVLVGDRLRLEHQADDRHDLNRHSRATVM